MTGQDAAKRAKELAHGVVSRYWSITYDDGFVADIAGAILTFADAAVAEAVAQAVQAEREACMAAICPRCRHDSRGPGRHILEKCDAAALRARPAEPAGEKG